MVRNKEISAVELLQTFLARVESYNPHLNAIVWMDREGALSRTIAVDVKFDAVAAQDLCVPLVRCRNMESVSSFGQGSHTS